MLEDYQADGVYKAIFERRDIREFNKKPIPQEKLKNILLAGHHAPSVGFMQPCDFIIIKSQEVKDRLAKVCQKEVQALSIHYEDDRKTKFLSLKLEGLKEAPVTICVTCDPTRGGGTRTWTQFHSRN
jgi:5,6-dimethylbenzimidazole synthase